MDGVDEPCSPTPPTGQQQHQSGHLMCYEGRTSSRALDKLVHSVRGVSVANREASSQLPPYRPADMILPDSDDSEATCRPIRRFSLRVRLRPLTTSTKLSSGNSRRWRLLQPLIAQPVVGWTSGQDRRV